MQPSLRQISPLQHLAESYKMINLVLKMVAWKEKSEDEDFFRLKSWINQQHRATLGSEHILLLCRLWSVSCSESRYFLQQPFQDFLLYELSVSSIFASFIVMHRSSSASPQPGHTFSSQLLRNERSPNDLNHQEFALHLSRLAFVALGSAVFRRVRRLHTEPPKLDVKVQQLE